MDTNALKKFAQAARNLLIGQVNAKLDLVLADGAAARREHPRAVKDLENALRTSGRAQVVEQVAYIWFNRFTALRFMDANGYTQVRVVSPADGQTRPELLAEAAAGNLPDGAPAEVSALLEGRIPSNDPQAEAYRLLLVHACNAWHGPMPFLFEELDDYTELLMPEDLLSQTSILARLRAVMTEDACQDVEIIGWLYQFYISEKKDQVFAGLKKNQKITAENIPAATQLFTPHWIVRYLVENSLGRLWLLNRPQSKLAAQMDYYIAPEEPETDFLRIGKPEEIKVCDPACGSGHMLTYAFDLLYAIYEEEGYDPTEIPALILTHNLTGVEIDDRAGALAAFALAMKAAAKLGRRRFLRMEVKPDIVVLQPSRVTLDEVWQLWTRLPGSFDDSLADLRGNLQSLPGFTEDVVKALDHVHSGLEHASSADAIMALSAPFEASLESSLAFFKELAANPKVFETYEKIARDLWGAVVNRHTWNDVERTLKDFRKCTGAIETSRRLEGIMLTLMKPVGPSEVEMNVLSHFQSRLKYASGQTERLALFQQQIEKLGGSMQSCLQLLSDTRQFEQVKNFGSLIVPKLRAPTKTLRVVEARNFGGDLLLKEVQERVMAVLRMAEALSPKYHVVVANPPYMGGGGMNLPLKDWAKSNYSDSKSDLFSMFIDRCMVIGKDNAMVAMVTMQNWMFISSFEKIRRKIINQTAIKGLIQIGFNSFPELNSKYALAAAFALQIGGRQTRGDYINLNDAPHSAKKDKVFFEKIANGEVCKISSTRFLSIPGAPVQYSFHNKVYELFENGEFVKDFAETASGLQTNDNGRFIKFWNEVPFGQIGFGMADRGEAKGSDQKWFPHVKGGPLRKWWGNLDYVVNWKNDGAEIFELATDLYGSPTRTVKNLARYFQSGATWTDISAGQFGVRKTPSGSIFDTSAPSLYSENEDFFISLLNSKPAGNIINALCPSLHYLSNDIASLPLSSTTKTRVEARATKISTSAQLISAADWDAYETSWNFTTLPLLQPDHRAETLQSTYATLRSHWQGMTDEMQRLEEENNRIFIDAYGLQDELTPEVPLNEITLTCNPAYRYGIKNDAAANETRLLADTMAEFLSYAVGCMFGRYSLDVPGLILANQGETLADYLARVPDPTFLPDKDNVIPVLYADWFSDDITDRFRQFLRLTFGEDAFRENLRFIEEALGKDIRKYFTKDFYADHVKRYKKRPIYWMFSSPKGTFNALIYMHRYRGDTVSVLLNEYLREFVTKLEGELVRLNKLADDPTATQGQRTKALKDAGVIAKQLDELNEWEREVIFPLAQTKIEIDLDDGVKANYPKFGTALKKIVGLEVSDE